jgi:SNF2 family DNA or RNA helicase
LVADSSPQFRNSRLYMDSLLRLSPATGNDHWVGQHAAIDHLPYQLEQPRERILIADSVGLGKTIEIGILLGELIKRGRGKRMVVLTTNSMMGQFQKELWSRFTIPLVRVDSIGFERVRSRIRTNANPFNHYDKAIISIDTLKQNAEFRAWADKSYWDIIVIEEAYNVAFRGSKLSLRSRLADLLSRRYDTPIMARRGKAASFASLMNMLSRQRSPTQTTTVPTRSKAFFSDATKRTFKPRLLAPFRNVKLGGTRYLPPPTRKLSTTAWRRPSLSRLTVPTALANFYSRLFWRSHFSLRLPPALRPFASVSARLKRNPTGTHRTTARIWLNSAKPCPANFAKYQRLVDILRPGGDM